MTLAASVLVNVSLACCDTCRHLVWTRGVSIYFHVPILRILPRVVSLFHSATCAFLVVTRGVDVAKFCSASCRLQVPIGAIFLLDHVSSLHVVSGLYMSIPYWTTCQFLIGLRIRYSFSWMPISDHHVFETWMLNLSFRTITCRLSYRSISSQNEWNDVIIPRK